MSPFDVINELGELEPYSAEKLCGSIRRTGVSEDLTQQVCQVVEQELKPGMTTAEIFRKALGKLKRADYIAAARYSLKRGIMELGPAGFYFEEYLAAVLREYGYETKRGQILQGYCVTHEIDVVADKGNEHWFVEAKYHNERGMRSDVHVALSAQARFMDLKKRHEQHEGTSFEHGFWVITNTKLTSAALQYAKCVGIRVTGWTYPRGESLEDLISNKGLYPVTVLPSMNRFVKSQLAKERVMFARDLLLFSTDELQNRFGISTLVARKLTSELSRLVQTS